MARDILVTNVHEMNISKNLTMFRVATKLFRGRSSSSPPWMVSKQKLVTSTSSPSTLWNTLASQPRITWSQIYDTFENNLMQAW